MSMPAIDRVKDALLAVGSLLGDILEVKRAFSIMQEDIQRLSAENEKLKIDKRSLSRGAFAAEKEIEQLKAENLKLKEDLVAALKEDKPD